MKTTVHALSFEFYNMIPLLFINFSTKNKTLLIVCLKGLIYECLDSCTWGNQFIPSDIISFRYKITELSGQGQYLVDMKLAVCFSDWAPCHMENTIVSNYLVTKPTCAWFTGYKVASKY